MRKLILAGLLFWGAVDFAHAEEDGGARCTDLSVPKTAIESHNGKWVLLTRDQWQFLRGVYTLNPNTPPGMPYGDKAALAQVAGDTGGLIFFLDAESRRFDAGLGPRSLGMTGLACTPMAVPKQLIDYLLDLDTIPHEGGL